MPWVSTPSCWHRVQLGECILCNPSAVVAELTCSGCGSVRRMSLLTRAGTALASNATFLCAACAPVGDASGQVEKQSTRTISPNHPLRRNNERPENSCDESVGWVLHDTGSDDNIDGIG